MNLRSLIILSFSLIPTIASAQTEMTVNPASEMTENWGTARTERYDVAFRLSDSSLVGTEIIRIAIPFESDDAIAQYSIWLTRKLQLKDGENEPDIIQLPIEPKDGFLSVSLPEPISIPEEGCFIGFSFTVNELNNYSKAPIKVSPTAQAGEMYVHTSRRYLKWETQNLFLTPEMNITLSGDFHQDAVAVITLPETGSLRNEETTTTAVLRNHGLSEVASVDYRIEINETSTDRHIEFDSPIPTHYFADIPFTLELDSDLDAGSYPMTFTITKVNNMENEDPVKSFMTHFFIYPYLPERIPLMEEYTGTWCGWCPRGIVGMERMTELYPEKFVYAAYHRDKDPMNTVEEIITPYPYQGAPSGYLDRRVAVDPYNGIATETVATADEGIGAAWKNECHEVTTGVITAHAIWSEASHETITINSEALFVRDYYTPRFRIAYLLTADSLKGEGSEWIQHNYYSGLEEYNTTELNEFVEQPRAIVDMSYDGVVVMYSPLEGIEDSLPPEISMEVPAKHSYSFTPGDAVNYLGDPLPIDKECLSVIAYIVDSYTGEIVNCAKCAVTDDATVDSIAPDQPVILINGNNIIISGINGVTTTTLRSASGLMLQCIVGEGELNMTTPPLHGVYILTINGVSKKIIL